MFGKVRMDQNHRLVFPGHAFKTSACHVFLSLLTNFPNTFTLYKYVDLSVLLSKSTRLCDAWWLLLQAGHINLNYIFQTHRS